MDDLLAECLQRFDEAGESGLSAFLAEHPAQRPELEARIEALRESGLLLRDTGSSGDPVCSELGDGEFVLGERLGGGGMGVVHRARQRSLERDVAIKLIRADRLHHDAARSRFQREAQALAGVHHPGILPVFASGQEGGQPWFAMELIDGRSLDELREHFAGQQPATLRAADVAAWLGVESSPWRPEQRWHDLVAEWGAQAAAALHSAHRHGVVHRDVKPSNLMLSRDGRVLLFDFGLTTSTTAEDLRLTSAEEPVGSPVYMSPEQMRGAPGEPRSDVYGLGLTLYELLALELPFSLGGGRMAVREQILAGTRIPLRYRNRRVPTELEVIVETAMAPVPQHRYADAGELHDDLRRYLNGESIRARRPGAMRQLRRVARRHPARSVALLLAVLVIVGGPLLYGWQQARSRRLVDAERQVAERNLDTAILATERFLAEFGGERLAYEERFDERGLALLADAVRMFEDLHEHRPEDPRIRGALARAMIRSAWQARRRGALDEAVAFAARSIALVESADDPGMISTHAHALRIAARIERARDRLDAAESYLRRALTVATPARMYRGPLRSLSRARADLGRLLDERGASREAVTQLRQALAEFRLARAPGDPRADVELQNEAHMLGCLAMAELQAGEPEAAAATQRAKAELIESAGEVAAPGLRAELVEALDHLAREALRKGDRTAARALVERACTTADELVDSQPEIIVFRDRAIDAHLTAADVAKDDPEEHALHLATSEQLIQAEQISARRAAEVQVKIARRRFGSDLSEATRDALVEALDRFARQCGTTLRRHEAITLGQGHQNLAVEWKRSDPERAVLHAARARDVLLTVREAPGASRSVDRSLSYALATLADALRHSGDLAAAAEQFAAVLALREQLLAAVPEDGELWHAHAGTLFNGGINADLRGDSELARARAAGAVAASRRALALRRTAVRTSRLVAAIELEAGLVLEAGDPGFAEARAAELLELEGVEPALAAAGLLARCSVDSPAEEDRVRRLEAALDAVESAVSRGLADPRRLFEPASLRSLHREPRFIRSVYAARAAGEER